jgi:hypothetical protein
MPPHEDLEGRLIVLAQEVPEQGAVGLLTDARIGGQAPDVPENSAELRSGHR